MQFKRVFYPQGRCQKITQIQKIEKCSANKHSSGAHECREDRSGDNFRLMTVRKRSLCSAPGRTLELVARCRQTLTLHQASAFVSSSSNVVNAGEENGGKTPVDSSNRITSISSYRRNLSGLLVKCTTNQVQVLLLLTTSPLHSLIFTDHTLSTNSCICTVSRFSNSSARIVNFVMNDLISLASIKLQTSNFLALPKCHRSHAE